MIYRSWNAYPQSYAGSDDASTEFIIFPISLFLPS